MQEKTTVHNGVKCVLSSPVLVQYDPVWQSQHFRENDCLVKIATVPYLQRYPNANTHQDKNDPEVTR